jgi:hypothetical protein
MRGAALISRALRQAQYRPFRSVREIRSKMAGSSPRCPGVSSAASSDFPPDAKLPYYGTTGLGLGLALGLGLGAVGVGVAVGVDKCAPHLLICNKKML